MKTAPACLITAVVAFVLTKALLSWATPESVRISSGAAHRERSPHSISDSTLTSSTWCLFQSRSATGHPDLSILTILRTRTLLPRTVQPIDDYPERTSDREH
jgi:hypothetical protein